MVTVSVLIPCYKSESTIHRCIESLLEQNYDDYEIVIVQDPPVDNTKKILDSFNDSRIKYFFNEEKMGLSKSRNITIDKSIGEYLFFTDSDCEVKSDWIKNGLDFFHNNECVGVEGKLVYISEDYKPTFSERNVRNLYGKQYMTANIAYKRNVIEEINGFDEDFTTYEDREISIRVLKKGKILFNPDMLVYHQKSERNINNFLSGGGHSRNIVRLYKKHNFKLNIYWRVMFPLNLLEIFFPPIFLLFPLKYSFKTRKDWKLLALTWFVLVRERLIFWDEVIKERVFLL